MTGREQDWRLLEIRERLRGAQKGGNRTIQLTRTEQAIAQFN
ncbi:MAG: hypothetical protein ACLFT9_11575 [Coleofasciculus sp.]